MQNTSSTSKYKAVKRQASDPKWWRSSYSIAWERTKEAFARDWEQTKADFSTSNGHELNQNVADTVRQAAGKEYLPPSNVPNYKVDDFKTAEPALRYGHGASTQFAADKKWNPSLESRLREDWEEVRPSEDWDSVKHHVRSGFERSRTATPGRS